MDYDRQWHSSLLATLASDNPLFAEVQWPLVYAFLVACACEKLRNCPPDAIVPGLGVTPRDVAWDTCTLVFCGHVQCDGPLTTGRVCAFLRTVMYHDIVDEIRVSGPASEERMVKLGVEIHEEPPLRAIEVAPVDLIELREGDGRVGRLLDDIHLRPDSHPKFPSYVRCLLSDPGLPPRKAAALLGVSIREVNEMSRRLKRRLRRFWTDAEINDRSRSRRPHRTE